MKKSKLIIIALLVVVTALFIMIRLYKIGSGAKLSDKATDLKYHVTNFIRLNKYEGELWDLKESEDKGENKNGKDKCLEVEKFINKISESNFNNLSLNDNISPITDIVRVVKNSEFSQIEKAADEIMELINNTKQTLIKNNSSYNGSIEIINQCLLDLENDENNLSIDSIKTIRLLNSKINKTISDAEKSADSEE